MRLKEIDINHSTMKIEIDIMELKGSFSIFICDGNAKLTELPNRGETKNVTH